MQVFTTNDRDVPHPAASMPANRRSRRRNASKTAGRALALACGSVLFLTPAGSAFAQQSATHSLKVHMAARASATSTSDVTLDFVSADINDVLKALAIQSGANIVSSKDVSGSITVSLSHVTLDQALDMITRLSGYQYAKVNNAFVVGTAADLSTFRVPVSADQTDVTDYVILRYVSDEQAKAVLASRFPNVSAVFAQKTTGSKILHTESMDKTQPPSAPSDSTAAPTEAGFTDQKQYIEYPAVTYTVLLTGLSGDVAAAKDALSQLDDSFAPINSSTVTDTYEVRYASIGDMIRILNSLVPSLLVTVGPSDGFNSTAPSASSTASSSSSAPSSSGSSSGGSPAPSGGGGGSTKTGPTVLLLTGSEADIARADDILAKIDTKPQQLLYEAKVTEIDDSDENNLGLNWDFSGATTTIGELSNGTTTVGNTGENGLKFGTISRTAISNLATVTLDALISQGKAKTLADPNIAALNGYPASIFIGDTINYVQSITQATTGENVTTASVQVGITMRVTGRVGPDGYITLNIHPEVSSINSYLTVPGGGSLPNIATRYADTTVRVKDGETIAIGGLIQESDILNITKVPFFGDLPFFGALFQDHQDTKSKDEVVFLLKTSVMKNS